MNQLFNYIAIIIFILLIAVMAFLYLRHRLITRYRDLGIIFFLLLLLFIGFQVTDMEKSTTQQSQTTQMIPFIKAVARDYNVSPQKVVVNSTTLTDGILVRIEDRDYRIYEVAKVKSGILEQNGQLVIIENDEANVRFPLINDGQINIDVMELIHHDEQWVFEQIHKAGYGSVDDIYLGEYINGKLTLIPYPKA